MFQLASLDFCILYFAKFHPCPWISQVNLFILAATNGVYLGTQLKLPSLGAQIWPQTTLLHKHCVVTDVAALICSTKLCDLGVLFLLVLFVCNGAKLIPCNCGVSACQFGTHIHNVQDDERDVEKQPTLQVMIGNLFVWLNQMSWPHGWLLGDFSAKRRQ